MCTMNVSPQFLAFCFAFLSIKEKMSLNLMKSNYQGFFFSYNLCFLCLIHLPKQISILFSSRSFIVLTFSFNSIFYFELNFLYRVR